MSDIRIPTEIIQQFSAQEAWEYHLLPFEERNGTLCCYGEVGGRDYESVKSELEVISGKNIEIVLLETDEFLRLLKHYYRNGGATVRQSELLSSGGQNFLYGIIDEAYRDYASDIHFEPYEERCRVRLRIDGRLTERYVIEKSNYTALVNQVKIMANLDISEKRLPQDGRIFYNRKEQKFDVRVSSLPTIYGEKIVLRLLTRHIELLDLQNLGFDERQLEDYKKAIQHPNGLVLITGPTGSGKSTTLYATLRLLNRESCNILTIEDPVEYTLGGVNQVQLKEEIGLTFGSALRTFLRQDPDIIMLGEIRDADTAQMAIRSSLTGHLLLSTIHTNNAWGCVARLRDMGMHPYLIADTLVVCVAQRLVRLLCKHCRQFMVINKTMAEQLGLEKEEGYYKAVGCEKCYYTGYSGRKAIYEVIPMDDVLSDAIRHAENDISTYLKEREITTLREAALSLFCTGNTSLEELLPLLN